MNNYKAHITIMPLTELLDPQGKAVNQSLHNLSFDAITNVRIGKNIVLDIQAADEAAATTIADAACKKLLYNAVMEQYSIEIKSA